MKKDERGKEEQKERTGVNQHSKTNPRMDERERWTQTEM